MGREVDQTPPRTVRLSTAAQGNLQEMWSRLEGTRDDRDMGAALTAGALVEVALGIAAWLARTRPGVLMWMVVDTKLGLPATPDAVHAIMVAAEDRTSA